MKNYERKREISPALYSEYKIPINFEYEILVYDIKSTLFYLDEDGYYVNEKGDYFWRYIPLYAIPYSVKRSSDNKIFTIGDSGKNSGEELIKFELGSMNEIEYRDSSGLFFRLFRVC